MDESFGTCTKCGVPFMSGDTRIPWYEERTLEDGTKETTTHYEHQLIICAANLKRRVVDLSAELERARVVLTAISVAADAYFKPGVK